MKHEAELVEAYHRVLCEARHVMAMHRRIKIMFDQTVSDADKLQKAIDKAQQLEQQVADPKGAA